MAETEELIIKKEIINYFLSKNTLLNTTILESLKNKHTTSQIYNLIKNTNTNMTAQDILLSITNTQKPEQEQKEQNNMNTKIVFEYQDKRKKKDVQDFVGLFRTRYKIISKMLQSRQELQNLLSIHRLSQNKEQKISVIGIVYDKQITKNENIMLTIEDDTGTMKAVISKTRTELYNLAKDIVLDEIIGVAGTAGENIIFVNNIIFPEIPIINELKKSPVGSNILVLSDIHIGSVNFLEKEFKKFISWLKGEAGNVEQMALSKTISHIFIVGDLVDGVGVYPNQEKELAIKDIYAQYAEFVKYIKQIPSHIQIIISTGNHDAVRIAEPQPKITKELCPELCQLGNVLMVGNPSIVRISETDDFPGFDVLLYHGYSYDYYSDTVGSIKNSGRHVSDRNDLIMKFLLERRHLAPTYASTPYLPDGQQDPLILEKIPDFFLSGHVHKSTISSYRGVQIISGSCWQSKTSFQEKVGHEPEPCRVPIINLMTRQVKMLRFDQTFEQEQQEIQQMIAVKTGAG